MSPYEVLGLSLLAVAASMFLALFLSMKRQANRTREHHELVEKTRAAPTERCAACGMQKSEHHYNGAAYGVCGNFKRRPFGKRPKN